MRPKRGQPTLTLLPHRFGISLAVVALFGQLALGTLVPREAQATVASLFPWLPSICHADGSASSGNTPGRHHTLPGWVVCPFCLSLSVPAPQPVAPVVVPGPPIAWTVWRPVPPPARAPPPRSEYAAQPRGPPALI